MRIRLKRKKLVAGADLPAELARIASLNTDDLRSLWISIIGSPPTRQLSGDLLRRMVMHHVQEQHLGRLDRKLATALGRMADADGPTPMRLRLGSVLVREHNGVLHQVTVMANGFSWNDRLLPSLSAAAKAITGTKWNGYRFFGLRRSTVRRSLTEATS